MNALDRGLSDPLDEDERPPWYYEEFGAFKDVDEGDVEGRCRPSLLRRMTLLLR